MAKVDKEDIDKLLGADARSKNPYPDCASLPLELYSLTDARSCAVTRKSLSPVTLTARPVGEKCFDDIRSSDGKLMASA